MHVKTMCTLCPSVDNFVPLLTICLIEPTPSVVLPRIHLLPALCFVEMDDPEEACGENCLNRVLMIEWYVSFVLFVVPCV